MPDPGELLAVARGLIDETSCTASDAHFRRAISTAYYALFHKILRSAAATFTLPGQEEGVAYALIYRSFEHARIKEVCSRLRASTWNEALRQQLRRDRVSEDMRDFAVGFIGAMEARHLADYDPNAVFLSADVEQQIASVESAIAAFDRTTPGERTDILALMMVKPRA